MNFRKLLHWLRQIDAWLVLPAILVVIWGELVHSRLVHALESDIWDKSLHFSAYSGLSLMTTIAVRANRRSWWWALGLILLGGVLEIVQGMTGRDGDLFDELANMIGVFGGLVIGRTGIAILKARKLVEDAAPE